ncbi:chromatin remodelling complex Rsc7/Swp82 subunit-domain-containing protein [Mucor mucedo]|uniref:chromatin remodelling complex Rsc7/Swp82 subunit-domain-containing protein n=1 Tax=Mucor mucedo TaxID=29922 RepID=UPI002220A9BE|nr:chromatin remodelling complex Rsc7/Swp82 subunit-domain-containing protein [Mucor mucedo]KAI7895881.1 chromatin remodelling complex Rsc7/Swp82 subunit-domain-containing protein [Mucor mucedo]
MEPSKLLGYRDSHILFQKHPQLKRVRITDEERHHLIETGLLITRFKNPEVAVLTARSLFKCFGHKVVKNGKRIQDDYFEREPERHHVYTNPDETREEEEIEDNSRKSLIGKTSRSEGYASDVPLNNETWMHHAALAARGFNAQLHERRAGKPTFYDIHSNINQVPASYQPSLCHFEFTKESKTGSSVEFIKKSNVHNTPLYRGLGKDLLEYDIESAIQSLSTDSEKEQARHVLALEENQIRDEEEYPLSLMEGQFQSAFPLHQARFNYPIPKIPEPTILVETAQSLAAQQYYLSLVYQSVNQYADPHRQPSPIARLSPTGYVQPSPIPPQHMMQQPQRIPIVPQQLAEPAVCGTLLSGNQICKRPVNRPGEKCQLHLPVKPMSDYAKAPPPATVYSDNKCADCHELRAAEGLFTSGEEHITDDFSVVKCSKCTRKYHPVCANLTTPRQVAAVESYPWSCPECKICCVCKSAGDESTLMICDDCDRGWHTGCCNPPVEKVPEGSWLCPLCADCHGCDEHGMAEESQYKHAIAPKSDRYKYPVYLATYCHSCYDNFAEDRFCPVCLKTYGEEENDDEDNEMVACDTCDHWIHTRCDEILTPAKYQVLCDDEDAKYSCPMCEERLKRIVDTSTADLALKGLSAPSGVCVGLLGGKVKTRGVVKYKNIKIGVPEINGTGVAEMPANFK